MYLFIILPLLFVFSAIIIGNVISAPGYNGPSSDHFDGKQFKNYDNIKAKGLSHVIKWMLTRSRGEWVETNDNPKAKPKTAEEELTVHFVNHASFLIQWRGINILTDPIWSERCSPFTFAGPQRMRPPGISFENLPAIDLVLLSHNHYDHLDLNTLRRLNKKNNPSYKVPLGIDVFLLKNDISNTEALDWWQTTTFGNLEIMLVPAQHFSGRGMMDRDRTLWGGYIISDGQKKLYFAGDTGYNSAMFDDIASRHPNIDLALLPVGAYKPRWFMSPIHISPEEAVIIHKQLNCKKSVGMHYGTFPLADEAQFDPPQELQEALEKHEVNPNEFILIKEGDKI